MQLSDLKNKKIALLGFGIENQALLKYLAAKKLNCEITICDYRPSIKDFFKLKLPKAIKLDWKLGKGFDSGLEVFDFMFRSPGWPTFCPGITEALKHGAILYSPMKLFFDLCPTKNLVGVTGTKGKGTTASLIQAILKEGRKKAWLAGNIGVAPFEFIRKIKKTDWVALELSSFHLEDLHLSPRISVITNLFPEHLQAADPHNPNYHKSLLGYYKAKENIFLHQGRTGNLIANASLKNKILKAKPKGKVFFFTKSNLPSRLVGGHNKENIAAAEIVAKLAGVKIKDIKKAVAKFKGLEHRLELVKEKNKVKYYNDTFATTPESTMTAINSFAGPVILLAGGAEKNSDFKKLARVIKAKVKKVILLEGSATPRLKKELLKAGFPLSNMHNALNINQAVGQAVKCAQPGDIVLLSTACASFGMFKNYKERGKFFKEEVKKI